MRRFHLFLFFIFLYLSWRFSEGFGLMAFPLMGVLVLGLITYPSNWLRKSQMNKWENLIRWFVYLDIGFLCFLTCLTMARDFINIPLFFWSPTVAQSLMSAGGNWALLALSFMGLKLGMWNALSGPRVKHVQIPILNLPPSLHGYRIAQISDLHVGPTIGPRYVKKVVRRTNALKPHLTVLTGDIVDGDVDHHLEAAQGLRHLQPQGQTIFVMGNHEYYWDGPRWIQEFQDMGLQVLLNSNMTIHHDNHRIAVAGILDPASSLAHPDHQPDLARAAENIHTADVKILLSHQPDIAFEASKFGFHLLLSGHTHAGQFFPFTWLIFSVQKFVKGLKACGPMWV